MENKLKLRFINFLLIGIIAIILISLSIITTSSFKKYLMEQRFYSYVQIVEARFDKDTTDLNSLCHDFNNLDSIYNVFAAVYNANYELLTNRHPDLTIGRVIEFKPFDYDEIKSAINKNQSGFVNVSLKVILENGKYVKYPMPIYFWNLNEVIIMIGTPYIEDTISLPIYFNAIIYIIITCILAVFITLIVIKI